jgi:hypothetical protein
MVWVVPSVERLLFRDTECRLRVDLGRMTLNCLNVGFVPIGCPVRGAVYVGLGVESSRTVGSNEVGSVGDSYDNAPAESIIGLYKTELIRRRGPWRDLEAVEFAALEWVYWFNHSRLLEPIGYVPPAELEAASINEHPSQPWRLDSNPAVSEEPGAVQPLGRRSIL